MRLRADEGGPADGPLVLLSHGGGQTRASWGLALEKLVDAGMRVVALDLRGHGESDWDPQGRYDPWSVGADLCDVVDLLGEPVVLVGASMGGMASLTAAAALGERAGALVLVDVVPRLEQAGVDRIRAFMTSHPEGFATLEDAAEAVQGYLQLPRASGVTRGLQRNLRRRADGRWQWHWDPALLTQERPADGPESVAALERDAARLRLPVVLVRGLQSDVVSDEGVEGLREIVPHLQVVDLLHAAHTAAADDNDGFAEAVLSVSVRLGSALP